MDQRGNSSLAATNYFIEYRKAPEEAGAAEAALRAKYGVQYDQVTANSERGSRIFWEVKPV